MKQVGLQNWMTSSERIVFAQSAVEMESLLSGFAGEIKMAVSEQKKGLSQCSCSSTTYTIPRSGLATRKNGITCTNPAKPVGVLV